MMVFHMYLSLISGNNININDKILSIIMSTKQNKNIIKNQYDYNKQYFDIIVCL
jgi:hypothetical protein